MAEGFLTNKEKLEFKQIVLEHLKKILELSTHEFTGGYWQDVGNNPTNHIYVPDARQCYIQAIESLADVLLPHYDKVMQEALEKYETDKANVWPKYKEEFDVTDISDQDVINITERKLRVARTLFQKLNLLLKRIDYLNKAVYTEDDEPEVDDIDRQ